MENKTKIHPKYLPTRLPIFNAFFMYVGLTFLQVGPMGMGVFYALYSIWFITVIYEMYIQEFTSPKYI